MTFLNASKDESTAESMMGPREFEVREAADMNASMLSLPGPGNVLGPRRRLWALAVILAGIVTFFLPLVRTDTAVLGKTHWSLLDIALQLSSGELPPSSGQEAALSPAYLGLCLMLVAVYLLLLYSAAAVLLSVQFLSKKLSLVGFAGIFIAAETWQWDKNSFEQLFFGQWSYYHLKLVRHVGFGQLILAIIAVMAALAYIAKDSDLDREPKSVSLNYRKNKNLFWKG
jgi:hypothetical protein